MRQALILQTSNLYMRLGKFSLVFLGVMVIAVLKYMMCFIKILRTYKSHSLDYERITTNVRNTAQLA